MAAEAWTFLPERDDLSSLTDEQKIEWLEGRVHRVLVAVMEIAVADVAANGARGLPLADLLRLRVVHDDPRQVLVECVRLPGPHEDLLGGGELDRDDVVEAREGPRELPLGGGRVVAGHA